jgi:histidine phosphotransfer protein HptB
MIDWTRVETLRDEVGAEDFGEIVALFLEEVESVTDRLSVQPDLSVLHDDMHFLKGSAMSLGFSAFSELCKTGEVAAGQGQASEVNLPELLVCYQLSKETFLNRASHYILTRA